VFAPNRTVVVGRAFPASLMRGPATRVVMAPEGSAVEDGAPCSPEAVTVRVTVTVCAPSVPVYRDTGSALETSIVEAPCPGLRDTVRVEEGWG
jgi:hypothetical protein